MKQGLIYGVGTALAGAFLTLALYFFGIHSDMERMLATRTLVSLLGFAISIGGVVLAMRAARTAAPDGGLSYGRGVLVSLMVGIASGVVSAIFMWVYVAVINPEFAELNYQVAVSQAQERGMSDADIANAEGMMRLFTGPTFLAAMVFFMTPVMCVLIGLVAAIFLRRQPTAVPPPLMTTV